MPNLSSVVNYFASPNEGFATTLGSTISSGAVTVPLAGTSGLTNGSIFVGIIEPGATNQQVFTGIVDTGGSQITNVVWTRGNNNSHVGGVSIVDYVTGTAFGMMSKGILVEHNQSGTHGAITSTNATLTTPTIITPTTKGTVDGWIGANESWVYASATTITVPTDATTKYDIGDYIKLTQSSTVKYFIITSITSTVLTVAGMTPGALETVANSAITLNSYSKARSPHGLPAGVGGAWLSWTPSVVGITVGNGVFTCKYTQVGKTVHGTFLFVFGTTSDVTGSVGFGLPVAAASRYNVGGYITIGTAFFLKNGSNVYPGTVSLNSTTSADLFAINAASTYATREIWTTTTPFDTANADAWSAQFTYEAA